MTSTEFWLAWLFNLQATVQIFFVAAAVGSAVGLFGTFIVTDSYEEFAPRARQLAKICLPTLAVLGVLASTPTAGDLWKLRINLLKLEVASPENVAKLGGHVEEVVMALECKHLGVNCPKPEKESK